MPQNMVSQLLSELGVPADLFNLLIVFALILIRFLMIINMIPFMGGRQIPGRIKISLAIALSLFVLPMVNGQVEYPLPQSNVLLFGYFLKETALGFIIGLATATVFYGLQAAGSMIDNQRQLANAQIFNPSIGSQASLFGVFYYQFGIIIFLVSGAHLVFFNGLIESFNVIPIISLPQSVSGETAIIKIMYRLTADVLKIALQISAPVLITIFVADLILGLTNRIAPMVNVFDLGFNIKGWMGVLMVLLSLPIMHLALRPLFWNTLDQIKRLIFHFLR